MTTVQEMADLLRERGESDRGDALWSALMVCSDCDDRIIDHDEVRMRCTVCRCDQSARGLSSYADDRLQDYGRALKLAFPDGAR